MPKRKKTSTKKRKSKPRYVPYSVNNRQKKIKYNIRPQSRQHRFIRTILIHGFTQLPPGFYKNGNGFTGSILYLLGELNRTFDNEIEIHVLRRGNPKLEKLIRKTKIFIEYNELRNIAKQLGDFRRERSKRSNDLVAAFLHAHFPRDFRRPKVKYESSYQKDKFAEILRKKAILKNLSHEDIDGLASFYPKFLKAHSNKLSKKKRLIVTKESKNVSESIYLANVIKEFEDRLKRSTQKEEDWQVFLKEYILLFNTNYSEVIDKENISLTGDYPDFLLVNIYEYLDIYEIKKPTTLLLNKDTSRNNYYWSVEISKAISQVENYIELLERHKDAFINDVKANKGIDIRVIKPRGYIIAGTSSQIQGKAKEDDFKLLNSSLKNIEIILYDDFLKNLKNLLKRIK